MAPEIEIYDTTLRDGTQGEGVTFSVADKLRDRRAARRLRRPLHRRRLAGLEPARTSSSSSRRSTGRFKHARLAAFGSTRRKDVRVEQDDQVRLLLDAETPVVTIFGKTWLLHVREVLQTTPEENLAMIADTVRLPQAARQVRGLRRRARLRRLQGRSASTRCATWQAAERGGADIVVALRHQRRLAAGRDRRDHPRRARRASTAGIGIHTHDDIGLGVANALAAVDAGATHVQGTINGYGERTGNCNLTSVMPILQFKLKKRVGAGRVAGAAEGAVAVRRRDGEHPAQPAAAVGRRGGLLAQGRHARERRAEGDPQLRAHRSGARSATRGTSSSAISPAAATS